MPGEMARITALPVFDGPPAIPHGITIPAGITLRPAQVAALQWWAAACTSKGPWGARGLLVGAGCGTGKTLLELLLPAVTDAPGYHETVYLTPAGLVTQLEDDCRAWALAGLPIKPVTVYSHEYLSAPGGRYLLGNAAPKTIVIDECHRFGNPHSGRWRRVAEYLRGFPDTRVVMLSGSLMGRSLHDWRHLALAALRDWSPLPADSTIDYWAAACDPHSEPDAGSLEAVAPLVEWAGSRSLPEGPAWTPRAALHRRLTTAPGVVLTTESGVEASLCIDVWAPPSPHGVTAALEALEARWELPDGSEVASSAEWARHANTLALGGWARYRAGTAHPEWLAARRAWARMQRDLVTYQGRTYQTPGAVTAAVESGELGGPAAAAYKAWVTASDTYPAPDTVFEWLPGGQSWLEEILTLYAARGDASNKTLVWTRTPEIGKAIASVLTCEYRGAGSNPPTGGDSVVSQLVHGTGWNSAPKYGYSAALVLEPPSGGDAWEQLLSRLHRTGQESDVTFTVLAVSPTANRALDKAIKEAVYARDSTGAPQRLLDANWQGKCVNRTWRDYGR